MNDLPALKNETGTLAVTLLPLLNACQDYSFVGERHDQTMAVLLQSLKVHISDNQSQYEKGFVICALRYQPSLFDEIVITE